MNLLTAATRAGLRAALLIFVLGGGLFYVGVRKLIYEEVDEELRADRRVLQQWINRHHHLPGDDSQAPVNHMFLTTGSPTDPTESWRDSTLFEPSSGEQQPYRLLTFPVRLQAQTTRITLGKALVEADALFWTILSATTILGVILLVTLTSIYRWQSRRLLQPFYHILHQLTTYQLRRDQPLQLQEYGDIDEFDQLSHVVNTLTQRAIGDYRSAKAFTANASHELQSPLAVIQSKLEVLLQHESLPNEVIQSLLAMQQTIFRLGRLNQTLLLLAKIEHGQFGEGRERVDLLPVIREKLSSLQEWIDHQAIVVETHLEPAVILIHPQLADIFIANLIGNAVKHNQPKGSIHIYLSTNQLRITNTGQPLQVDPIVLFERFQKASHSPHSIGLGLAIVREIGEQNGLQVTYTSQAQWHELTVSWPSAKAV